MTADQTAIFEAERAALTALCYRMLGERAEAEDAVQETWLRWQGAINSDISNPGAWLRRAATNIAIDTLKSARIRRETYVGPWLPEPLIQADGIDFESAFEQAQECELALLWAMERLDPVERAIFILREAFDASYDEIAITVGRSSAACRQTVSRAHKKLQEDSPRFDVPENEVQALITMFFSAIAMEDFDSARKLFAPDAIAISDGGRKARAARRPLIGPDEIIQVWTAVWRKSSQEAGWLLQPAKVNRAPAIMRLLNGSIDTIITLVPNTQNQIHWLYMMRNPDKLPG
ncbi:MAG: RNA polymerase sigma factor SigJ [Pseudomonadota bacterium]